MPSFVRPASRPDSIAASAGVPSNGAGAAAWAVCGEDQQGCETHRVT